MPISVRRTHAGSAVAASARRGAARRSAGAWGAGKVVAAAVMSVLPGRPKVLTRPPGGSEQRERGGSFIPVAPGRSEATERPPRGAANEVSLGVSSHRPWRRRAQACSRLMASSIRKALTSITTAIAVAPT